MHSFYTPENIRKPYGFQGVEKGCIGNKLVNGLINQNKTHLIHLHGVKVSEFGILSGPFFPRLQTEYGEYRYSKKKEKEDQKNLPKRTLFVNCFL